MKLGNFVPQITPDFICRVLGKNIPQLRHTDEGFIPIHDGSPELQPFPMVTTDSRAVVPWALFVAIPGEKFDGHDFIPQAIKAGARVVIHRRDHPIEPNRHVLFFAVEDTVVAFRQLAHAWRREFRIPVIAVAGSVGKTSTKELLSAILQGKYKNVLKTLGSQNGFLGIPITVLSLTPSHDIAVIEVGIDDTGAMEQHHAMLAPTAALLTRIAAEHLEKLRDLPTVAYEEGLALTLTAEQGGIVVLNLDDPWIRPHASTLKSGVRYGFSFGQRHPPTTGLALEDCIEGQWADAAKKTVAITSRKLGTWQLDCPLPGDHNAGNLLAAVTLALGHGMTPDEIRTGLATFQGAGGRSELADWRGSPVICDYYNASPASVDAGIQLLGEVASARTDSPARKKWACLGDMLELGTDEETWHRSLAKAISEQKLDGVLLYGKRMPWLADELKLRQYPGHVSQHESHEDLVRELRSVWKPGDAILIKGSRGMRMENVWKLFQDEPRGHSQTSGQ